MVLLFFSLVVCVGYEWVNILTLSPPRVAKVMTINIPNSPGCNKIQSLQYKVSAMTSKIISVSF